MLLFFSCELSRLQRQRCGCRAPVAWRVLEVTLGQVVLRQQRQEPLKRHSAGLPEARKPEGQCCERDRERGVRGVDAQPEPACEGGHYRGSEASRQAHAGPDGHVAEQLLLVLSDVLLDWDMELVVDQSEPP